MQQYPTTLFHKEHAPEGQIFMTEADVPPAADGWVETPAAFVAGYVKPAPVVPADEIPADAPPGFVPNPYPAHRYRENDADHPRLVASAEEDDALEAAEPGVWKRSPDPKHRAADAAASADAGAADPNALADLTDAGAVVLTDAQKAEVHAAKAAELFAKVSAIRAPALLEAIAAAETEKPGGARSTVLKAIKARLAELKVSAE